MCVCGVYVCVFITRVIKLSVVARNEHVSATHIDNSNKSGEERQQRNKRRSRGRGVEGEGVRDGNMESVCRPT